MVCFCEMRLRLVRWYHFQFTEEIMFKETEWLSEFLLMCKGRAGELGQASTSGFEFGSFWYLLGQCAPTLSTHEMARSRCVTGHANPSSSTPVPVAKIGPAQARVLCIWEFLNGEKG